MPGDAEPVWLEPGCVVPAVPVVGAVPGSGAHGALGDVLGVVVVCGDVVFGIVVLGDVLGLVVVLAGGVAVLGISPGVPAVPGVCAAGGVVPIVVCGDVLDGDVPV